jgi:tripartite-type tricarboxylate transporter receptor subunit TctC
VEQGHDPIADIEDVVHAVAGDPQTIVGAIEPVYRAVITFGEHRTKRWPQVPTLNELGYGIVATSPYGLVGPRGLPAPIVQVLHDGVSLAGPKLTPARFQQALFSMPAGGGAE